MTTLVLKTHSSDDDFNADLDYAVLRITPEMKRRVMQARELFQMAKSKQDDIVEIVLNDASPEYYPYHALNTDDLESEDDELECCFDEKELELYKDNGVGIMKEDFAIGMEEKRTECDQLHISEEGFYWSCYPRHCSITISTENLGYDGLLNDFERKTT